MELGSTEPLKMVEITSSDFKRDAKSVLDSVINNFGKVMGGEASPLATALHKSITEGLLEDTPKEIADIWSNDKEVSKYFDDSGDRYYFADKKIKREISLSLNKKVDDSPPLKASVDVRVPEIGAIVSVGNEFGRLLGMYADNMVGPLPKPNLLEKISGIGADYQQRYSSGGAIINENNGPIGEYRKNLNKSNPDLLVLFDTLLVEAKTYDPKKLYNSLAPVIDRKVSENYKHMRASAKIK